jgi:hypothetical protein
MIKTSPPSLRHSTTTGSIMTQSERATSVSRTVPTGSPAVWVALYLATAILSSLGLLGKVSLLQRILPLPTPLLAVALCAGVCLPLFWPLVLRIRYFLAPLVLVGFFFTSLVVFPKVEQLHAVGRGSDQPDCVIVAANEMMSARWPYRPDKIFTHNAMSCGPGWVAMQAPVVKTLGYRWDLIAVTVVSLAVCLWAQGLSMVCGLVALLGVCPGFWLAASNGTDFLPFGIALAALFTAAGKLKRGSVLFVVVAGLLAQFRVPTLLLPVFFTKRVGKAAALSATVLAIATEIVFLLWNPASFVSDGPMHVLFKLTQKHLFSSNPIVTSLEIGLPLLLAAIVLTLWEERSAHPWGLFVYMYAIFFPPAVIDVFRKIALYHEPLKAIGFWEGGLWILACLPVTAVVLIVQLTARQQRITSRFPVGMSSAELESRQHLSA